MGYRLELSATALLGIKKNALDLIPITQTTSQTNKRLVLEERLTKVNTRLKKNHTKFPAGGLFMLFECYSMSERNLLHTA